MAHEICPGTWRDSTLTPTGRPPEHDGRILINTHLTGPLTGKHLNSNADLLNTACDGTNVSFARINASEEVHYSGRIISVSPTLDRINGNFTRIRKVFNAASTGQLLSDGGDWTAEKPT